MKTDKEVWGISLNVYECVFACYLHAMIFRGLCLDVIPSLSHWFIAHISWRIYEMLRSTLIRVLAYELSRHPISCNPIILRSICLSNKISLCCVCTASIFQAQNLILSFQFSISNLLFSSLTFSNSTPLCSLSYQMFFCLSLVTWDPALGGNITRLIQMNADGTQNVSAILNCL